MVAGGENTLQKWSRFEQSEVEREGDARGVREKESKRSREREPLLRAC
jgi:hypothetical protein